MMRVGGEKVSKIKLLMEEKKKEKGWNDEKEKCEIERESKEGKKGSKIQRHALRRRSQNCMEKGP